MEKKNSLNVNKSQGGIWVFEKFPRKMYDKTATVPTVGLQRYLSYWINH